VHSGNLYFGNRKLELVQFFRENFAEQLAKVHEAHGVAKLPEFQQLDEEVEQLRGGIQAIQNSPSYRLGHGLLAPARLLRKLWRCFN
jgi:hypothetical protein